MFFLIYNIYTTLDKRSELVCLKKVSIVMSYGPFFIQRPFFITKIEGINIACLNDVIKDNDFKVHMHQQRIELRV